MPRIRIAGLLSVAILAVPLPARAEPDRSPRAAFPPLVETPQERVPPPSAPPRVPVVARVAPASTAPALQDLRWAAPVESGAAAPVPGDRGDARKRQRISDDWMLSLEAVTHAPVDVGLQVGFEAPPGLRLSGGYGLVPAAYLNLVTRAAASASGADPLATALITDGFQGGHSWRIQGGIRPFPALGLYLDAGYARVALSGTLDSSAVPNVAALGVKGGYSVEAALDMWLVELGYQAHVGDHVVLAVGAGVMGTFAAHTSVSTLPGSVRIPAVDSATSSSVDALLVQHGFLPTLTLRLGADLI